MRVTVLADAGVRIVARRQTEFTALFVRGKNESKRLRAMFSVDHEIGIKRPSHISGAVEVVSARLRTIYGEGSMLPWRGGWESC